MGTRSNIGIVNEDDSITAIYCHSDMTTDNFEFDSNNSLNPKSSKGINFVKDDMTTIKDNTIKDCDNWRSSVQKSLDKLSAKTNGTTIR